MDPPQKQIIDPSMASSSSSSSSSFHSTPPSSSSQSWKHDVFLSFRGTDVRNTFVDHLYSALVQKGIDTYKDDKTLPRGETIGPSLFKAIEESQIVVIVFSENYAGSSWCLQELVHIMKCKDERGLTVMPIFYHIDPSELRNQKNKYGEALVKHKSKKRNVESWRKALVDAGNLSGDVVNGPETIFIKQIVDTISNRLRLTISSDNEDLIGMKTRLEDLKSKMGMESNGVLMVGIWGLGGGGKTTLASALYDEISSNFDGSCFLKYIREESSKHALPKLQKEILALVLKLKRKEIVGDVGRLLKSRFRHKKVLMVLDDVDHVDQLNALVGSNAWFGDGSRIIITTRDNHLLYAHNVNVMYNICLLNDDEAIQLFCKHAPRRGRPIKDYKRFSQDVISYAGGLPLALIVLGSFLCDKDKDEWMSALARLKDIPESDIVEKLKISYDGLKPKEKELFLDIACFFRGESKDEAIGIFDACDFHPIIGIRVLIQKALITVSEKGIIDMHDLIQEMGHHIVRGENPKNPELHSRVWQRDDVEKICAMDEMTENNRIEALQLKWHHNKFPAHSLSLVVGNMKKLRWMSWYKYSATQLAREFQPMELCYLKLENSLVEQLWEGYKHLPNLKVLDLTFSTELTRTPDVNGLPYLERMILKNCFGLKEIHPSIGYHQRLIFLDMEHCTRLEIFPPIIEMKKLETLLLSYCSQLSKFPEIQTSMDNLVELNLKGTGVIILPSSVGQYCTNLISLDVSDCNSLQSVEGNIHLLKHLKGLYLNGCDQLKNIPTEGLFYVDCCLNVLSLSSTSFYHLHRGVVNIELLGFSHSLRRLNLRYCSLLDGNFYDVIFGELSNLQVLDLSGNNITQLYSILLQLPCLKFLDLSYCYYLEYLPDLPSSIAFLRAYECPSLQILEDFPTNLKWLWKVSLSDNNCNSENVLQSMLQGNAIGDYFISLHFSDTTISTSDFQWGTFTLQLPLNWLNEFSGFLIRANDEFRDHTIIIKDVVDRENAIDIYEDESEVSDEDDGRVMETGSSMCYISFGSLRHTSWGNSTHNAISFSLEDTYLKVELVPIRSKGDSIERAKDPTNSIEYWDEGAKYRKTFEIIHDSKSSIEIQWYHDNRLDKFYVI